MEKENDLIKKLERTNILLRRLNSPSFQFYLAVIRGIGTAIGVTIIGGIVIGVLDQFVHSAYDLPIIGNILQQMPSQGGSE